ncbi:MAG: hypothetical protein ACHBN1_19130 [Heteroscytonema crispum UTEX LB 1556]
MKRIVASSLLGILLASSFLAKPASAQVQIRIGENVRRDRFERQRDQRQLREREYKLQEQRERERRERERREREWRERHRY